MTNHRVHISAAPLVAYVERHGGASAVLPRSCRHTYTRAKQRGEISVDKADTLAVALGLHPVELWGAAWNPEP